MDLLVFSIAIASLSSSIAFFLSLRRRIRELEGRIIGLQNEFKRFVWENFIITGGKSDKELFRESALELAKKLFKLVKKRFRMRGITDYSELIDEIEKRDIKPKLKAQLIEFFSTILALQYSNKKLSEEERRKLKRDAIELIRKMGGVLDMPK